MDREVLYDKKRLKLLRRARLFNWVPFIKKVYIAGSVALGTVHENSDFDVIVVVESGRLYTARFFCLLLFGLLGWRRTLKNPKDGFCFNHFTVNEDPSYLYDLNNYANQLYQNLIEIPVVSIRLVRPTGIIEPLFKWLQVRRIKKFFKKFPPNSNSRIIYNNERVELCFFLKNLTD